MANNEHVSILMEGAATWNKWRERNSSIVPDLSEVLLDGQVLSETNLPHSSKIGIRINLKNVNLANASLVDCVLDGAQLRKANLRGANLRKADLRKADLREADLTGCRLNRANLTLARLYRTNFTRSHIWETVLSRVNLSGAIGLENCVQGGPSIIDERTFRESGNLPEKFLRGCGYTDWQIVASKLNSRNLDAAEITSICYEIIKLRSDPTLQYFSCFISYSHKDKEFANSLHDFLQDSGIRCWLDEHQLLPGDDIFEHVDRGIRLWDKVLLICSKDALRSWWVDNEVLSAFEKEQSLMKERKEKTVVLIPIDLDGYVFSNEWTRGYKSQIQSRSIATLKGWKKNSREFDVEFEKILTALRADSGSREQPPTSMFDVKNV